LLQIGDELALLALHEDGSFVADLLQGLVFGLVEGEQPVSLLHFLDDGFFHFFCLFGEAAAVPSLYGDDLVLVEIVERHVFLLFHVGVLALVLLLQLLLDSSHEVIVGF
jgi:hypothetical protein